MSRFIDVNGVHYNMESIRRFYQDVKGNLHIELTDGFEENISSAQAAYVMTQLSGSNHVVQIIPATEPLYAVYEDEQPDSYFAAPVYYLAVCADGEIRGVWCCDGYFECIEEDYRDGSRGLYCKDDLGQFPGAIESVMSQEVPHGSSDLSD